GIAPHELVDEPLAAEQPVECDLDVVHRAVVEVDEQRAAIAECAARVLEVRREPRHERVRVVGAIGIAMTTSGTRDAGAEWRINVDRVDNGVGPGRELVECVAAHETIGRGVGTPELDPLVHDRHSTLNEVRFCAWYPLAEAGDRSPAAPGIYQVRLAH